MQIAIPRAASRCLTLTVAVAGCAGGSDSSPGWQGSISDSAGIAIVDNFGIGQWPEEQEWSVEVDLVIGEADGSDDYTFGRIGDVAVGSLGQLFVLDDLAQEIKVYDAEGTFVRRIGGPGEGPGELSRTVVSIFVAAGDTLYVNDYWQRRISVYDENGNSISTIRLPQELRTTIMDWAQVGDRSFLSRAMIMSFDASQRSQIWDGLLQTDGVSDSFDTLMTFEYAPPDMGTRMDLQLPLIGNAAFYDRLADGRIAWSALDENRLFLHASDGTLERIVKHGEWRRVPASDADRAVIGQLYQNYRGRGDAPLPDNIHPPEVLPVITAVLGAPDGTFWVQRMGDITDIDPHALAASGYADRLGGPDWDVFDFEGRYLGGVALPARIRAARITDSAVVGVQKDDLDIERVVRLRIHQP